MSGGALAGRHAVVTGGGRGIGAAIATRLAQLGADLTLMGRTYSVLESAAAEVRRSYRVHVRTATLDVTDEANVEVAFLAASDALGPAVVLVNNAGVAGSAPFKRMGL